MWSRLGVAVTPVDEMQKMRDLIHQVQVEMLTTLEAMSTRLAFLEGKVSVWESRVTNIEERKDVSDNVFDFVTKEELELDDPVEPPEFMADEDTDTIQYVESGFTAPSPEEEIEIEMGPEEEDWGPPDRWADNVINDILGNGGSVNQYWKRFGLIPQEMSKEDKASMLAYLKQKMLVEGISKYNVNRMRHFYYKGTEEEGETKYDAFIQ